MKHSLLLIILTIISCNPVPPKASLPINSKASEVRESRKPKNEIHCALAKLQKTIHYKNELKKYDKINGDSLVVLENKKIGNNNYRTVLELSESEQNLWLLIEKETEIDSILIQHEDFVEYLMTVESEFDLNQCEIKITETQYFMSEEPEKKILRTIKI